MRSAVITNLYYETQPIVKCLQLWKMTDVRMSCAGFTVSNRRFGVDMDAESACNRARRVMECVESKYKALGFNTSSYIRDFHAVRCDQIMDLSVPASHAIEVDLMDAGAFQAFFETARPTTSCSPTTPCCASKSRSQNPSQSSLR